MADRPYENISKALSKTDWRLLCKQKQTLIGLLGESGDYVSLDDEEQEHLQGILNWIDALQDAAEKDGFPVEFI